MYALLSRYWKKRRMPYHCLFQLPSLKLGVPSITQCFCSGVSLFHGVSRGMPAASAWRIRSSCASRQAGVWMGLTAPARSVRRSSGITRPQSTPITRPNPRQLSHAPTAELNENIDGIGSA